MPATTWNGRFFENDGEEMNTDFDPDHVVTVSELTGELPKVSEEAKQELLRAEEDDYRQLLAEVWKPYVPPVEKQLSRGMKILILVLAIAASIAGGLLTSYGFSVVKKSAFSFPRLLPVALSTMVFLFSSFGYFCTKGKTEKLLMIVFLVTGAIMLSSFFISI